MASITKYILSKRVARGGMAELFLAKAVDAEGKARVCAVKRILPHFASDREYLEMFRSEAGICKKLQHPNIVRVFDFRNVEGHYALIMEFVSGTDLRTLLAACEKARLRLSVPMSIYMTLHVARGLHYAHTKIDENTGQPMGIVHRDISPQNILVSFAGEVKIIDFGIANFESKNLETKPGIVKGKYSYMSPEQVSAKRLDARSDVFSLAILLWEALGMKRLFAGETEVETIANVQNCAVKFNLKDLNKNVDDALMRIIAKGLEKDRKYRYASAQAMERDLQAYLTDHYPDFKPTDLGEFVSQLLAIKRIETNHDIKKMMTANAAKGPPKPEPSDEQATKIRTLNHANKSPSNLATLRPSGLPSGVPGNVNAALKLNPESANEAAPVETANREFRPDARSRQQAQRQAQLHRMAFMRHRYARRRARWQLFWGLLTLLAIAAGGYGFWRQRQVPKGSMQLVLKTKPARVRLLLDGKRLYGGKYINTPLKIAMPAGGHKLGIERGGYDPVSLKFNGGTGEVVKQEDAVLRPAASTRFSVTRLEDGQGKPLQVDLDRGLYVGKTPVTLNDLDESEPHILTVYPNFPANTGAFKCTFYTKGGNEMQPFVLVAVRANGGGSPRCIAKKK